MARLCAAPVGAKIVEKILMVEGCANPGGCNSRPARYF